MRPSIQDPYWRRETPTVPCLRVSEIRMAIRKKEKTDPLELAGAETKVPCPCCDRGLVTTSERDRLRKILAAAAKEQPNEDEPK